MKKSILLSWIILALSLFAIVRDTNAIQYGGGSTRAYPQSFGDGRFFLDSYPYIPNIQECFDYIAGYNQTWEQSIYCQNDADKNRLTYGYIAEYDPSGLADGEYVLMSNTFTGDGSIGFGGYEGQGARLMGVKSGTGLSLYFQVKDEAGYDLIQTGSIGSLPEVGNSNSFFPNRFVFSMWTEYGQVPNGQTFLYYLREINFCFYLNDADNSVCLKKVYIDSNTPNGLLMGDTFGNEAKPRSDSSLYTAVYYPWTSTGKIQAGNKALYEEFMTGTGLTQWLGGVSTIYTEGGPTNQGTGTTGTGTISFFEGDYFSECEGITDVGCYIKGWWTGLTTSFSNIIDSLFPEISFNGAFDSCGTFDDSEAIGIMQRFANILALINPIPPETGIEICTIYGPKIIGYQVYIPEQNLFGVYIPGVLPEVENINLKMAFGQTPIDLIIIFGMMAVIFYQKSKHD